ncbi:DUF4271 domain-containing protein [Robertkochia sediminum]|uniref:DUF4271 domain-containing protein n=1 Tax=Robertkochia sediminum TaxID=2785326 RepID=UPI0019334C9F|nr:DUF4271 domain-containing protein [Robertkochia sediminum]MBL7473839.1 DUF4271 domain-containing protein [Robertkochia sediminum]
MNEILRNTQYLTTESILLFISLLCITLAKVLDEQRFHAFLAIIINQRYLKVYSKEQNKTQNRFNLLLFVPQLVVIAMIIKEGIDRLDLAKDTNILVIISFLTLFILFKYYLEKIIATIFEIGNFTESFQFHKLTYRNYSALILLPLLAYYTYSGLDKNILIVIALSIFLLLNLISLALTLLNHQKSISRYLFYFILYLCALEIAPYLILANLVFTDKA